MLPMKIQRKSDPELTDRFVSKAERRLRPAARLRIRKIVRWFSCHDPSIILNLSLLNQPLFAFMPRTLKFPKMIRKLTNLRRRLFASALDSWLVVWYVWWSLFCYCWPLTSLPYAYSFTTTDLQLKNGIGWLQFPIRDENTNIHNYVLKIYLLKE